MKFCSIDENMDNTPLSWSAGMFDPWITVPDRSAIEECDPFLDIGNDTVVVYTGSVDHLMDNITRFQNFDNYTRFAFVFGHYLRNNKSFYEACNEMQHHNLLLDSDKIFDEERFFSLKLASKMCDAVLYAPVLFKTFGLLASFVKRDPSTINPVVINPAAASAAEPVNNQFKLHTISERAFKKADQLLNAIKRYKNIGLNQPMAALNYSYHPAKRVNNRVFDKLKNYVKKIQFGKFKTAARTVLEYRWTGRLPSQNSTFVPWVLTDWINYLKDRVDWLFGLNVDASKCKTKLPYWGVNSTCSATTIALIPTGWLTKLSNVVCTTETSITNIFPKLLALITALSNALTGNPLDIDLFVCAFLDFPTWQLILGGLLLTVVLVSYCILVLVVTILIFQIFI